MLVYIRNIDDQDVVYCGEMNYEQLSHFKSDLRFEGIYDGDGEHHYPIDLVIQYIHDSENYFYIELVWWDE
jgi:hypothetical protein